MSKVDELSRMVANWECVNAPQCDGYVSNWSYYDLVIKGNPVCPRCDDDMVCVLTSAKVEV